MRKIKEILRLKMESKCSNLLIACSIGVSTSTVSECLRRMREANISWPLPDNMDDDQLNLLLYPPTKCRREERGEIDWAYIHQELKRKHVTLMLLWHDYRERCPKGIGYSQFCGSYRLWSDALDVWMRQNHKAGEKCFVDYSGTKIPVVINSATGEIREAEIFVGTLGASSFTYVEATWTQQLPDWIQSHVNAFEFFGGVPEIIVPDNLKSGVDKAHHYEPDLNPTYQDMASHYQVAVLPARVRSPKDKAKVENAVLQVERHIIARLRDHRFFSLYELNQAIQLLLKELNQKPFQKLPGSRESQFQVLDKPALKPLPATRYQFSKWKKARPGADYHIELEQHFYSVPYTFIKKELDVRYTQTTVEIFYKSKRIASHIRNFTKNCHTTIKEHMPKRHQLYAEWTPERIVRWAEKTGAASALLVEQIMASRQHPQQGFRSCFGILRLAKSYGNERLESACQRAIEIGAYSYKSVESILKNGLDKKPLLNEPHKTPVPTEHDYVRGQHYFH